jgi:hypothetical protein
VIEKTVAERLASNLVCLMMSLIGPSQVRHTWWIAPRRSDEDVAGGERLNDGLQLGFEAGLDVWKQVGHQFVSTNHRLAVPPFLRAHAPPPGSPELDLRPRVSPQPRVSGSPKRPLAGNFQHL